LISVGFLPHDVGLGNAVFVAQRMGLRGGAWNLETACAGPLTALQTAVALVRSGEYQNVLVTVSCAHTRCIGEDDTQSWFVGDGGGAFVVSKVDSGTGYLAGHTMHTADTLGTWYFALDLDDDGQPARVMRAHQNTAKIMRKTVEAHLRRCCGAVAGKAGLKLQDIDYFVFHTPTAWFAEFAADALDIEPERTASVFPHYGNVGPALTPIGLHHAAATKRLRPGQTVLVYGPGSASSTAAVIMRWGEVALGPTPAGVDYGRRLEPV
jgi:3-oxoacyl-[acyl-carrier-protein] synthase-3